MVENTLGGMYDGPEYQLAMLEAKLEFDAWEQRKRRDRKSNKEKYRAKRLAKLDMQRLLSR